ncbi:MAG: ABC transporter permease [Ruminococcus sp.]|nr:ABC transporter permease [Ruminococcus sp.]
MQVFKTFMKVLKKNLFGALMYLGVFAVIFVFHVNANSSSTAYTDVTLNINIIDEDASAASGALAEYIGQMHEIVSLKNDKEMLLDALFYQKVNYVLMIQDGYEEKLSQGITDDLFRNYQVPGSYANPLFEQTLNEYVKTVCAYMTGGADLETALEKTSETLSVEIPVTKETFAEDGASTFSESYAFFFQFLPYILISVFMNSACPVLMTMNRSDLKKRTDSSCMPQSWYSIQTALGCFLIFLTVWLIMVILSFLIGGGSFDKMSLLAILNSFVFALVSAGITMLCSVLIKDKNIIAFVTNLIGLGMSFLCGVFVSQDLLGEGVLAAARFLPAYWYVKANNILAGLSGEFFEVSSYLLCLGIQLGFAAVFFLSYFIVGRNRYKEGKM